MRILGIDPGTVITGWGVVDCESSGFRWVASGTVRAGRGEIASRLGHIYRVVSEVIENHRPQAMSLEGGFLSRNVQSAFRLGEGRGVVMAAAATAGLELCEYSPAVIKKAVVGYGRAEKSQVQAAMMRMLGLREQPSEDEADALAAAVCHGLRAGFDRKLARARSAAGRRARA